MNEHKDMKQIRCEIGNRDEKDGQRNRADGTINRETGQQER